MKKREITCLSLLEREVDPGVENSSNFFFCPFFGTHEREAFSGSLEVHMHAASAEDNEP